MKPFARVIVVLGVLAALAGAAAAESPEEILHWSTLPVLPDAPDGGKHIGVAGPFTGVHNDALIVAGGANFPDGPPWRGESAKIYHDRIYILVKDGEGHKWGLAKRKLDS